MKTYHEFIKSNAQGHLEVEGVDVLDLVKEYGSPLFVTSANQLRHNVRRFKKAFEDNYPERIVICCGVKSNNGLAVRRIIAQEGAGGDTFGLGELYSALAAGTDPDNIVMNGSNKAEEVIEAAINAGITMNLDCIDELKKCMKIAERLGKKAIITFRMRIPLYELEGKKFVDPRYGGDGTDVSLWEREYKFGLEPKQVFEAYEMAKASPWIHVRGLQYHGGIPRRAGYYAEECKEVMHYLKIMKEQYDWEPEMLDLGGGFTSERYGTKMPDAIEDVAKYICDAVKDTAKELGLKLPVLFFEPGRWCVESAVMLVATVGAIKHDTELTNKTWYYLDANINENLDPFDPHQKYHEVVYCNNTEAPAVVKVDVAGQLCNAADLLAEARMLPEMKLDDVVAILDMGAYNESFANTSNSMPRSAGVLVDGNQVGLYRRRETVQDIFSRDITPFWLF